jgi:hypothetical protein
MRKVGKVLYRLLYIMPLKPKSTKPLQFAEGTQLQQCKLLLFFQPTELPLYSTVGFAIIVTICFHAFAVSSTAYDLVS